MIARNFFEVDANILYPRIDMAGENTGIIGSEFPLFNYLIYFSYKIFGFSHWIGRLINLIVSSIGICFFYSLLKKLFNKRVAFNSGIILLSSIWFGFSRKIMPDTFSVSLVIIGLYFCYSYLKSGSIISLVLFFVFSTLGVLCKIPALSLMSLMAIPFIIKEISWNRKVILSIVLSFSFLIICLWYFYWVPYLLKTYHYQLYFPKSLVEGVKEIAPLIPEALEKFYFTSLMSYLGFLCFIAGIIVVFKSHDKYLKMGIVFFTFIFILFIIKTGSVFPLHSYYIIPFTPLMALVAGFFLSKIPIKFQIILLILIAFEGIANQQHDFFIKSSERYKLRLEEIADKTIGKDELIIINGGQSPQQLYFSHRKGWTINSEALTDYNKLDSLNTKGAKFLIVNKNLFHQLIEHYPMIYSDNDFDIFKLQ